MLEVGGYLAPLLAFLDRTAAERFIRTEHRSMLLVGDEPEWLLDAMATYRTPRAEKWIDRSET